MSPDPATHAAVCTKNATKKKQRNVPTTGLTPATVLAYLLAPVSSNSCLLWNNDLAYKTPTIQREILVDGLMTAGKYEKYQGRGTQEHRWQEKGDLLCVSGSSGL